MRGIGHHSQFDDLLSAVCPHTRDLVAHAEVILDITAALRRGGGGQYYLTPPSGGHFHRTLSPGALPLALPTSSEGSSVGLNWQKMRSRGVSATLASTLSRPRWGMPSTKLSTPSATELSMIWFKAGIRTYRPQGSSNNMAVRTTHKGLCSSGDGPWTASWNTPHHTPHILHPSHPSPHTHTSQPSHSHPSPHTPPDQTVSHWTTSWRGSLRTVWSE